MTPEVLEVELRWQGPFTSGDPLPPDPGLYAVTGVPYGGACECLFWIGEAKNGLRQGWRDPLHRDWLKRTVEWLRGKLYFTVPDLPEGCDLHAAILTVEKVLIYVHQPHQNYRDISAGAGKTMRPSKYINQHVVIRNHGETPHLVSEVDTRKPWFGIDQAFRVSPQNSAHTP